MSFYWPLVIVVCICFLATLYHVSVPVRTNWSFNLPGATFSLLCWILGSAALRWILTVTAAESRSIYGPLAAPIAVLLWLYLLAIAVLIGAAVNAAFDTVFPQMSTTSARAELMARLRRTMGGTLGSGRLLTWSTSLRRLRRRRVRRTGKVSLPETHPVAVVGARRGGSWPRSRSWSAPCMLVYFDRDGYRDSNDPTDYDVEHLSTRSTTRPSR